MGRTRTPKRQQGKRTGGHGGRRRAVPRGLGLGIGVVALLMTLAFAAVKIRACSDEAARSGDRL